MNRLGPSDKRGPPENLKVLLYVPICRMLKRDFVFWEEDCINVAVFMFKNLCSKR